MQISAGDIIDAIRFQYGTTWGHWHGDKVGAGQTTIDLNGAKIIKIQGTGSKNHYYYGSVIAHCWFLEP